MKKLILNIIMWALFIRSIVTLINWFNGNSDVNIIIIFVYLAILTWVIIYLGYSLVKNHLYKNIKK
ncbi:hypothetical protein A4A32_10355 [Staphylococcus equorum]|uniref:Uncharacterized protein n=1 Tax=Staphylococcus equorum TaxID=246432 RepID=A0AAP7IBV9_9STAP|nr:hypothetical protein AWC34_05580 [Staphylococcus equorum]ERH36140.1 hypothetical protein SEQU_03425 [Staphylococcus equorum UMC-CNS-924]OEK51169.1 hypothetical protein ASS94_13850 [Staphylococcus equorum]OEK57101.1 hypothetical protein ASS97_03420 [Staphylococcus equorum]OEK60848.1 hypothetical protein ASS98_11325 [Staphylococcus equorum]